MDNQKYIARQIHDDSDRNDISSSCFLFPWRDSSLKTIPSTSKVVHFVRHAFGLHNAVGEVDHAGYLLEENEDSMLAPLGIQQCKEFSNSKECLNRVKDAEVVLLSPMRRTIQTANYCFPFHVNKIPWVGLETLRERSGLHPCDRRRPISELSKYYAHVDFSSIAEDEDPLYYKYPREPDDVVNARCRAFMVDLCARKEKELIVVGHSSYLDQLFTEIVTIENAREDYVRFKNCEMRSFIIKLDIEIDQH